MILGDFLRALAQMTDPRFVGVIAKGVGLALMLLGGVYAAFLTLINWLAPNSFTLPWIGQIGGVDAFLGWASLGLMLVASVFLMVPVAAAFAGIFADDVANAVEARHYPGLPPAVPQGWGDALVGAVNFLGVVIGVNALALVFYIFSGPAAPLVFWSVNGFLLGREYFTAVAIRRVGAEGARTLRKRHRGAIWAAGVLVAAPLSIPFVNLVVPVLAAATFTHLYHRLTRPRS